MWSLTRPAPAVEGVAETEPRPLGQAGLPWQRQDRSLPDGFERLETDGGAALVRTTGTRVSVLQLAAAGEEPARRLLAAARARGDSLHYVNVPEGDPASAALAGLGGTLELRQLEFLRTESLRTVALR